MPGPLGVGRHEPVDAPDRTVCSKCGAVLTTVAELKEPCPAPSAWASTQGQENE